MLHCFGVSGKGSSYGESQTLSQELVFDRTYGDEITDGNIGSNVILWPVSFNSRRSLSTNGGGGEGDSLTEKCDDSDEVKNVDRILCKWVNYGKGWRERWFVLADGVHSYYKVHGQDKIAVKSIKEEEVRIIGEESWRYMRNGSNGSSSWNGHKGNVFGSGKSGTVSGDKSKGTPAR